MKTGRTILNYFLDNDMTITFKLKGSKSLASKLEKYTEAASEEVKRTLVSEAEGIMSESKEKFVPVMTGALRGSGFVEPPKVQGGNMSVTLGFGGPAAPYAVIVHENPRSGKPGGKSPGGEMYKNFSRVGQWKYLEVPFNKRSKNVGSKIASNIKSATRGLKR